MSRNVRRAVILVVLGLVALLAIGDRLTEDATAQAVSVAARQNGLLAGNPTVDIRGFPFLTQAAVSTFGEIDITTHGIHRGGLRIETVVGRFRGVHVGLIAALNGQLAGIPIDRATGQVDVSFADLDTFLAARHMVATDVGGALYVSGPAVVAGHTVTVSGPVTMSVATDGTLTLVPVPAALRGPAGAVPIAAAQTAAANLSVQVALIDLPFGVTLRTAAVGPAGLVLSGSATGPAVTVPADASVP